MDEHFSEDDARRIFARAAERQGTGDAPEDGLSLDELKAIGQASGIDPAHVAAAAAELRASPEPEAAEFFGLPGRLRETRLVPGSLSDDGWARIVEDLRQTYGVDGALSEIGQTREWAVGSLAGRDGVRVTVRPGPDDTTEIVAQHTLESNRRQLRMSVLVAGAALAALFGGGLLLGDITFPLVAALVAALSIGFSTWSLRRRSLRDVRAFGPLLDRAELAARRDSETPAADLESDVTHAPTRLALDADAVSGGSAPSRRRRRTR